MLTRRLPREERGASALTIAIAMVVIMGMAAVAIDAGLGFDERRLDQTGADLSVMAGALDFQDPDDTVSEVLSYARDNLRNQYTDPEWQALWQSCVDSDRPIDFQPLPDPWTAGSTLDCISQSPSFLRVRIPDQDVSTAFARLIGVDELTTHAVAVATLQPSGSLSGLIPFGIRGGEGAGEICLQTAPPGLAVDPCTGPSAGSFGAILSHWFGNEFYSTTPNCKQSDLQGSNNSNSILDDNIAMGIDHFIGTFDGDIDGDGTTDWSYPWTGSESNNTIQNSEATVDDCTVVSGTAVPTDGPGLDTVLMDVGNDLRDDVTRGLVDNESFADGGDSRLQRIPSGNAEIDVRSSGDLWVLDNRPLWTYLHNSGDSTEDGTVAYNDSYAPMSCHPMNFTVPAPDIATLDANNVQMRLCLTEHYSGGKGTSVIFRDEVGNSIADSPRFAWAPQLWHDDFGSGTAWRPVYQYRMVYIAGTFFNCAGTSCDLTFYPGHPGPEPLCAPGCGNLIINQTTAFLLPDSAVPSEIKDTFPIEDLGPFQPRLWR